MNKGFIINGVCVADINDTINPNG